MPSDLGHSEKKEKSIALTAIFYTLMVIFVPMVTYSVSKKMVFDGLLAMDDSSSTTAAAVSAVVAVHIVLVFFIIAAFKEDQRQQPKREWFRTKEIADQWTSTNSTTFFRGCRSAEASAAEDRDGAGGGRGFAWTTVLKYWIRLHDPNQPVAINDTPRCVWYITESQLENGDTVTQAESVYYKQWFHLSATWCNFGCSGLSNWHTDFHRKETGNWFPFNL